MNPALSVFNNALKDVIAVDFEIAVLASDNIFTEGPVWNHDGYYLYSDITANKVYKIIAGQNKQVFIDNSGCTGPNDLLKPDMIGSNALAYYKDSLLVCQHGSHGIAKWKDNSLQPFISTFNKAPFNSPNDLIVHSDGRIFFSDPPYGLKDSKLNPSKFQPLAGIYCWDRGTIRLINSQYQYPNGVCLSPDQKKLYACSNKPFERFVTEFDTNTLLSKVLCSENGDGIETDPVGNIYLCSNDGIVIVDSAGQRLGLIKFETIPSNLCWGGPHLRDLFITSRQNIFLIRDLFIG
jgi:gluconolactonase